MHLRREWWALTLRKTGPTRARPTLELDVAPEVRWELALIRGISSGRRAIRFHTSWDLTVSDVGVGVSVCLVRAITDKIR